MLLMENIPPRVKAKNWWEEANGPCKPYADVEFKRWYFVVYRICIKGRWLLPLVILNG